VYWFFFGSLISVLVGIAGGAFSFLRGTRSVLIAAQKEWSDRKHPLRWAEAGFVALQIIVGIGYAMLSDTRALDIHIVSFSVMMVVCSTAMSAFNAWEEYKFCKASRPELAIDFGVSFASSVLSKTVLACAMYAFLYTARKW
jgi:hypothetical protein